MGANAKAIPEANNDADNQVKVCVLNGLLQTVQLGEVIWVCARMEIDRKKFDTLENNTLLINMP